MLHTLAEVVNFDKNTASHFFTKSYFKYSHLGDNLEFIGPVKIKLDKIIHEDTITKNIGRPERHTTLELQNIAKEGNVFDCITWKRAFSDEEKSTLLGDATAVVYTPTNEHFGIVPVECMAACKPVIACASGGPLESVESGAVPYVLQLQSAQSCASSGGKATTYRVDKKSKGSMAENMNRSDRNEYKIKRK